MSDETGNGPVMGVVPAHPNGEREDPMAEIAQEIATYRSRLPELLAHEGEFVLIKGDQVIGFFDDFSAALREGYRRFGLVPLLVKKIAAVEPVIYIPRNCWQLRRPSWKSWALNASERNPPIPPTGPQARCGRPRLRGENVAPRGDHEPMEGLRVALLDRELRVESRWLTTLASPRESSYPELLMPGTICSRPDRDECARR